MLRAARDGGTVADIAAALHLSRGHGAQPPVRGDRQDRRPHPRRGGAHRRASTAGCSGDGRSGSGSPAAYSGCHDQHARADDGGAPAAEARRASVDPAVVLAPMARITTPRSGTLCREFGAGLYVCEMITTPGRWSSATRRRCRWSGPTPDEKDAFSVQLYGVDPATVSAARWRCWSTRASRVPGRRTSTSTSAARCPR